MKIDELDEFQGITSEMIQAWLLANGWKQVEQMAYQLDAPPVRTGWLFRRGDETVGTGADISYVLANLSRLSCKTPQALLREINPRMRKGMPSEAAINACPFWLVRDSETHEIELHLARKGRLYALCDCAEKLGGRVVVDVLQGIVMEWERLSPLHLKDFGDVMQFWPCDKHGNKVRWPTDADGKML